MLDRNYRSDSFHSGLHQNLYTFRNGVLGKVLQFDHCIRNLIVRTLDEKANNFDSSLASITFFPGFDILESFHQGLNFPKSSKKLVREYSFENLLLVFSGRNVESSIIPKNDHNFDLFRFSNRKYSPGTSLFFSLMLRFKRFCI